MLLLLLLAPMVMAADTDGDGCDDDVDHAPGLAAPDLDGDGISSDCDLCVGDDGAGDPDGDGVCSDLDDDDDDDLCLDLVDVAPTVAGPDLDGDRIVDDCDLCLCDNATVDTDADGYCADRADDHDLDGCDDPFDLRPNLTTPDLDGDGVSQDCQVCPDGGLPDLDGDFCCGAVDLDSDGDGCPDALDSDPLRPGRRCGPREPAGCPEVCEDGFDQDGDGDGGCADDDCQLDLFCVEDCLDGADNDGDGLVDCDDPWCDGITSCLETCDDGVDNDRDGLADCADSDCTYTISCGGEDCHNALDDDGDGWTDCFDADCWGPATPCLEAACEDGIDNDGDGWIDRSDLECAADRPLRAWWRYHEDVCDNGIDDNHDQRTDCADPDCSLEPGCREVDCSDGIDNDADGLVDCEDGDCDRVGASCMELSCRDGVDNDGDGLLDCADDDCWGRGTPTCVVASIVDSGRVRYERRVSWTQRTGRRLQYSESQIRLEVLDVQGRVQLPAGTSCTWSFDHGWATFISDSGINIPSLPLTRTPVQVSAGCPLGTDQVVPPFINMYPTRLPALYVRAQWQQRSSYRATVSYYSAPDTFSFGGIGWSRRYDPWASRTEQLTWGTSVNNAQRRAGIRRDVREGLLGSRP